MKDKIIKMKEYLDYIEEHYDNVQKAWKIIQDKCKDMKIIYDDYEFNMINQMIKSHDESKLNSSEFQAYRKYFYPTEYEKQYKEIHKIDFDRAWYSHWVHNPHHWQCWTKSTECDETYYAIVEMIVDWMAMGMKFGDTAQDYYENNSHSIDIPEKYEDFMYEIFNRIYE